jgi:hypothetical protein
MENIGLFVKKIYLRLDPNPVNAPPDGDFKASWPLVPTSKER